MTDESGFWIKLIGGSTGIGGALSLFYKWKIEHKKKLEIEEFKIKLAETFSKRVEIATTTYQKLLDLNDAAQKSASKTVQKSDKSHQEFFEKRRDFYIYFTKNKIQLPEKTAVKISEFFQKLNETAIDYSALMLQAPFPHDEEKIKRMNELIHTLFMEIPCLLRQTENDFRAIVGVEVK